ncbi:MAG: isoprenylcysteine carboxylmethyltransferase family protein [Anaerolineae bacterium]|nr:isoprenylcysteine carboxylmethyltransferase family protein [Anaerolineae bacterium]
MGILHFLFPGRQLLTTPLIFLGIIPLVVGVAINLLADRAFSTRGTTVKPFEESSALVITGVFCLTRNPMYLGFTLVLIGIALLLGSLTPWAVVAVFAVLMEVLFIRVEEAMLEERFGADYCEYKQRTRRWI